MPPRYTLETERTYLTLLTEDDLPDMEAMAREEDTFKYLKFLRVMSPEEYTKFLYVKLEQIRTGVGYHWAVRLKNFPGTDSPGTVPGSTDGEFVGAVNLNPIKRGTSQSSIAGESPLPDTPRLQIGAQLRRDYWGQGFASELMQRLVEFGIDQLHLPAVYGVFEKDNNASRRLLEKLGFVFEESFQEEEVELEVHKYTAPGSHTV
jgi:RimJ/RimL family protein N-acetyltransferase